MNTHISNAGPLAGSTASCRAFQLAEHQLADSQVFRRNGLSLYCGVPVSYLEPIDCQIPRESQGTLDYLACRGDEVLMAIEVTGREGVHSAPVRIPELYIAQASVEQLERGGLSHLLTQIEALLPEAAPPMWICPIRSLPPELTGPLLEEGLLEARDRGAPIPTEYGSDMGLVKAVLPDGCATLCPPEMAERLEGQLYTFHDIHCVDFLRNMMDMPLEEYLKDCPEAVKALQDGLPDQCRTYAETAEAICDMLHATCGRRTTKGAELMRLLSGPLVNENRRVVWERKLAEERGALQEYKAQMRRFRQTDSFFWAAPYVSLDGFFRGVAALTRMNYPLWRGETLKQTYRLSNAASYTSALFRAEQILAGGDMLRNRQMREEGERLLYHLLIEPVRLIRERDGETPAAEPLRVLS